MSDERSGGDGAVLEARPLEADERSESDGEGPKALSRGEVSALIERLDAGDRVGVLTALEDVHAADLADLIEQLGADNRRRLIEFLGPDLDGEALTELEEATRDEVLALIAPNQLAEVIKDLDSDDRVYLVEDLEPAAQAVVLETLPAPEREAVKQSLEHDEYTAGRLMQRERVWYPAFTTVGSVIDEMRGEAADGGGRAELPEHFYEIIVIDEGFRPIGKVALSRLLAAPRPTTLEEIMLRDFTTFETTQSQEEVGYAFNQYHLVSAPVVDESGRLVGVITIDDAMQALDEEAEEDILRLGGVGDESLGDTVMRVVGRRFPWLAVNLLTAVAASLVIGLFDEAIEKVVALAILMPIVASMGGNAGTQTLTVAVRALATRDLTPTNALRIVARETLVGLLNGLGFAAIVGLIGYVWFGDVILGVVLALSMVINLLVAGLAGILIPLGLDRAGADPALASGVFVTTVTDVIGFLAFLGIAVLLLL